jgi:hypothetical protein
MVASGHKNSRIAHTVACAAGGGREEQKCQSHEVLYWLWRGLLSHLHVCP